MLTMGVIKTDGPCSINRYTVPVVSVPAFMKHLALKQNLHHFLIELLNLGFFQQSNDIVDRIPVRHGKAEQSFEVFLKLEVFTLLVIFVAGTRFEYIHSETSGQMSCQFKRGCFFAWIIQFTHPITQQREMMGDGGINLIDQVGFLFFLCSNC